VLLLDISKAAVPVGIAYDQLGLRGPLLFLIAIAPPLGHAFSPFLKLRGGKALATVLGVWIGLTNWPAAAAALLFVVLGYGLFEKPGWAVMLGLCGILGALLLWARDPLLLAVLAAQWLLLAWTHRADLRSAPRLRARWVLHDKPQKRRAKPVKVE
jgi:glycerol-3-phosphate acyltransferase PlsY